MAKSENTPPEIEFELSADTVVTNDTVKVSCLISVMLSGGINNENLKSTVTNALTKFIAGDWVFSNPSRSIDTGIEKATYAAHIRIPATENYDLTNRAASVNSAGVQISNVNPDVSIPEYQIRQTRSQLRVDLVKQAHEEAEKLSHAMPCALVVQRVIFGEAQSFSNSKSMRASTYAASANAFLDEAPGSGAIGNSERVSLSATVVLRMSDN